MKRAFLFPGQGSQSVGMGSALAAAFPAAREVFEEVDDALSCRLSRLMFEGPMAELTLTENTQPALMAVSMAAVRAIEALGGRPLAQLGSFVAGHSLGEYSALCAVGAFTVAEAARLLRLRGQAMQRAVPVSEGAMVALIGVELETARAIAAEAAAGGICALANDNAPGQVVLSGHKAAIERAGALLAKRGGGRSAMLPVSAPFHCALMAPATEAMAEALASVTIRPPALPLVSNVTARPVAEPARIRALLVEQVTGMVRWRESMLFLKDNEVEGLFELGAGKVLTGLAKRIDRALQASPIGTPEEVEAFLKTL